MWVGLTAKGHEHERIFFADGKVLCLDQGVDYTDIYTGQNSSHCVFKKCVLFSVNNTSVGWVKKCQCTMTHAIGAHGG